MWVVNMHSGATRSRRVQDGTRDAVVAKFEVYALERLAREPRLVGAASRQRIWSAGVRRWRVIARCVR